MNNNISCKKWDSAVIYRGRCPEKTCPAFTNRYLFSANEWDNKAKEIGRPLEYKMV